MKNIIKVTVLTVSVVFLVSLLGMDASAKKGGNSHKSTYKAEKHNQKQTQKQTGKDSATPYGWTQGKKTGWAGGKYPPGWSKWDEKKRDRWARDRDDSVVVIHRELNHYRFEHTKQEQIVNAFDEAIVGGMAINDAKKKLVDGIKDKTTRKNLMIDTGQTALELLR